MARHIFHIVPRAEWAAVHGEYRPHSLRVEGFVHCSFADQVDATLARYYAGVAGLLVVEFEPALIPSPVRVEDTTGTGQVFPHVYGPIPLLAMVAVRDAPNLS